VAGEKLGQDGPIANPSTFLRAIAECFARLSRSLGVRLSVCVSVCLSHCDCIKTVQVRITKSIPWDAPRTLVFRDKFLCLWVKGFPSNEGVK